MMLLPVVMIDLPVRVGIDAKIKFRFTCNFVATLKFITVESALAVMLS